MGMSSALKTWLWQSTTIPDMFPAPFSVPASGGSQVSMPCRSSHSCPTSVRSSSWKESVFGSDSTWAIRLGSRPRFAACSSRLLVLMPPVDFELTAPTSSPTPAARTWRSVGVGYAPVSARTRRWASESARSKGPSRKCPGGDSPISSSSIRP